MRNLFAGVAAFLGMAGIASMAEAQTLQHDEVARRAALRRPAHDLVADVRHRQHVPGHAGGDGLGRQDADPLSRQVVDDQPGRQALHLQAARRRAVLQRQEVHRRRRRLLLQAADQPRAQGAAGLARRQPQGHPRAPIPTRSSTSWTSRSPTCCSTSPCSRRRSTTRRASRRWARTTASRRSTAPARGASNRGSRAPRSCSSATTPTSGAPRCTRTRAR